MSRISKGLLDPRLLLSTAKITLVYFLIFTLYPLPFPLSILYPLIFKFPEVIQLVFSADVSEAIRRNHVYWDSWESTIAC